MYYDVWMDGLKVGEIKTSACRPQIEPNVHHTDKQIELDSAKRRNVHKNARIKELQ
jgi:hypothetical protein